MKSVEGGGRTLAGMVPFAFAIAVAFEESL